MKNYVQRGDTVTVTAPYAVLSGGGILITGTGHIFGVAVNNQSSGDSSEVLTEGVFDLTKDTSTFAEGDYVCNWKIVCRKRTSTATSNTKIGVAALTTPSGVNAPGGLSGDPTVRDKAEPVLLIMSDWSSIDAAATAVMQQTFGEPVVDEPVESGAAVGSLPLTITAIRHAREREESGATAGFEEISVNPSDLIRRRKATG